MAMIDQQQQQSAAANGSASMSQFMSSILGQNAAPHQHQQQQQQQQSLLDQQRKVFNPEAYCELCQKEFCNKYYLATHKATKHGIGQTPASMVYGGQQQQQQPSMVASSTNMFNDGQSTAFDALLQSQQQQQSFDANLFTALNPALLTAIIQQRQRQMQQEFDGSDAMNNGAFLTRLISGQQPENDVDSDQLLGTCAQCGTACGSSFALQVDTVDYL